MASKRRKGRPTVRGRAPKRRKTATAGKRVRRGATDARARRRAVRPSLPPSAPTDFGAVFQRLRTILREHEPHLVVKADSHGNYQLDAPVRAENGRALYFGGVRLGRSYVSYYLFPVYIFPSLLTGVSPSLRKRMQGKSCFNFTRLDETLAGELAALTRRGLDALSDAFLHKS